eukprot:7385702-Prymnesium_polylepis.1
MSAGLELGERPQRPQIGWPHQVHQGHSDALYDRQRPLVVCAACRALQRRQERKAVWLLQEGGYGRAGIVQSGPKGDAEVAQDAVPVRAERADGSQFVLQAERGGAGLCGVIEYIHGHHCLCDADHGRHLHPVGARLHRSRPPRRTRCNG